MNHTLWGVSPYGDHRRSAWEKVLSVFCSVELLECQGASTTKMAAVFGGFLGKRRWLMRCRPVEGSCTSASHTHRDWWTFLCWIFLTKNILFCIRLWIKYTSHRASLKRGLLKYYTGPQVPKLTLCVPQTNKTMIKKKYASIKMTCSTSRPPLLIWQHESSLDLLISFCFVKKWPHTLGRFEFTSKNDYSNAT